MLETKSISALAFTETPRKRKRETGGCVPLPLPLPHPAAAAAQEAAAAVTESCFTNAAFSSTPKKLIGRRRLAKENSNPFPCLEFKSIADLAQQQQKEQQQQQQPPNNPFEVVRHPCKKKKREIACFENPGLNLELPEKQFNPYEVIRCIATPNKKKGFVNAALNVRGSDGPASRNPFEIHRQSEISALASNPSGVANPALAEESLLPTSLKIGLPFVPTVGCRIDFHGMSLAQLTPSKLLAEKLVFSPVPGPGPKRSLGAISEESSSMDIGKELDRYQLELENSINEAKLRKKGLLVAEEETQETLMVVQECQEGAQVGRQLICTRRRTLTEISEVPEMESAPVAAEEQPPEEMKEEQQLQQQQEEKEEQKEEEQPLEDDAEPDAAAGDVAYASESDEEDFKAPARFVRAYRPAAQQLKAASKESLQSIGSSKSGKSLDKPPSGHGMKNMIRKSIRRLMHPMESSSHTGSTSPEKPHNNIMHTIRHSLRRRPPKEVPLQEEEEEEEIRPADISIVDSSERTMKLRSSITQTEYMTIEQLTNERKHTLRNSIRRSTRDVLRHVFHKSHDAYATAK
ncbi:lateral signaling target protein 2 homolog [Drosophila obscura]|uniref:lateral signaling target protein 2 homolog n=1 Tax=Drosophila obscura TaxID=7282 RepID=UPI001BB1D70C|nr:lateral signaling target protein 2 homolog [Drosophila obscura]